MASRNQQRDQIANEIEKDEYRELLLRLQGEHPFLRGFNTWGEVVSFMREGTSDDPRKDDVLQPIFVAHAADGDPRWRTILLVIFWPGIDSIFNQKASWDADGDERWGNVIWAFLQTVCKLDISSRTDHIVQRIINGTIHRLHDEYCRAWERAEHETVTDPENFEDLMGGGEGIDFDAIDREAEQKAEVNRLHKHLKIGHISEEDFLLLVATRIYGKSAAQYARETGISVDSARKRRLRAEAAIRKAEKNGSQKICPAPQHLEGLLSTGDEPNEQ